MGAFTWVGQFLEAIFSIFPRLIIVRATHAGVKWPCGGEPVELLPGLHIYWPLVTEYELKETARQTKTMPPQGLTTRDLKPVTIQLVVVFRVRDIIKAEGKINWDTDSTVRDISQAAAVKVICDTDFEDLIRNATGSIKEALTQSCRKELDKFGVTVLECKLNQVTTSNVITHIGLSLVVAGEEND